VVSTVDASCTAPDTGAASLVAADLDWIRAAADAPLGEPACNDAVAHAGEPGTESGVLTAVLAPGSDEARFTVTPPVGTRLVTYATTAELGLDPDLYVRIGAPPTTSVFDKLSDVWRQFENVQFIDEPLFAGRDGEPQHLLVRRRSGAGRFQLVYAFYPAATPEPPPGAWLTSSEVPGFRVKVRINDTITGARESACLPETLCLSGALKGRSEAFVRVIGPRPNGYLWPTLVKFTPSKVEVWIEQLSTGVIRYYLLRGAGPGVDELPGLFDRTGFLP
jgi:hypothetical protein